MFSKSFIITLSGDDKEELKRAFKAMYGYISDGSNVIEDIREYALWEFDDIELTTRQTDMIMVKDLANELECNGRK